MSAIPDPQYALTASGNLRRRQAISRILESGTVLAAAIAVAALLGVVYYVAKQGGGAISLSFFTSHLPNFDGTNGGIGPAIVGTFEVVLIATIVALPAGVLAAIYLTQYAGPRTGGAMRLTIDLMAGLPTIIAGVFVAILITNRYGQSAIAGGIALAIVEVPLIARASLESLSRVPATIVEAADALGVARWRTVVGVILPSASNGIVTATILAVARAAGETAPILLTTSLFFGQGFLLNPTHAVATVPYLIFQLLESGYPAAISDAWGAALSLMAVILIVNIGARVWLRRSNQKRGQ